MSSSRPATRQQNRRPTTCLRWRRTRGCGLVLPVQNVARSAALAMEPSTLRARWCTLVVPVARTVACAFERSTRPIHYSHVLADTAVQSCIHTCMWFSSPCSTHTYMHALHAQQGDCISFVVCGDSRMHLVLCISSHVWPSVFSSSGVKHMRACKAVHLVRHALAHQSALRRISGVTMKPPEFTLPSHQPKHDLAGPRYLGLMKTTALQHTTRC